MYYEFTASTGGFSDVITKTIIVVNPYFFLKKSGTMALGAAKGGLDIRHNEATASTADSAFLAIDLGSLIIHGGTGWLALPGRSIGFVPSTSALYTANLSNNTIAAYDAGTPLGIADPSIGQGIYIFKIVNGPLAVDTYYGMIKAISIIPGTSVAYEYRIANLYAHLGFMK
jgi:hypothetical protein